MADKKSIVKKKGKGQAARLSAQHIKAGGVTGIFGADAQAHDASIKKVAKEVLAALRSEFPDRKFRIRASITKREIHERLSAIDPRLGAKLFTPSAKIRPDAGIIEVQDKASAWRVVLVGESKHQGNDVLNIKAGQRTKVMEGKGQYLMPAGNAIERVHKNVQEMKNFMLGEKHFPYVVLLQGSNFATESLILKWPDGTKVKILPSDAGVNRIDRVTACNYGMEINQDYCKNMSINHPNGQLMLQAASVYAQCDHFDNQKMFDILLDTAFTSLEVLADELP